MNKNLVLVMLLGLIVLILSGCSSPNAVNIKLPAIFNDHMVVQRNAEIPIWGKADPGGIIAVEFANQKKQTKVDADGNWHVELNPVKAGGPYEMKITGAETK